MESNVLTNETIRVSLVKAQLPPGVSREDYLRVAQRVGIRARTRYLAQQAGAFPAPSRQSINLLRRIVHILYRFAAGRAE